MRVIISFGRKLWKRKS